MLITIVVVYAVCTLPYHITWLFSVFGYPNSVAKKLCVLLVIATSAAHPIIYGTLNKDFKKGFGSYVEYCKCSQRGHMESKATYLKTHGARSRNTAALGKAKPKHAKAVKRSDDLYVVGYITSL